MIGALGTCLKYDGAGNSEYRKVRRPPPPPARPATLTITHPPTHPTQLAVLIDEYDLPMNEILATLTKEDGAVRLDHIDDAMRAYRAFFESLKSAIAKGMLDRVLIAGVTPLVMHGVGSGFNIHTDLSAEPDAEAMCGFVEDEVREAVALALLARTQPSAPRDELFAAAREAAAAAATPTPTTPHDPAELDPHVSAIRDLFNGYRFSDVALRMEADRGTPAAPSLYNPQLVLRYLAALHAHGPTSSGTVDRTYWSDSNVALSEWVVRLVSRMPGSGRILDALALHDPVPAGLVSAKGVDRLVRALDHEDEDAVQMLLLHHGVATFAYDPDLRAVALVVPNRVSRDDFLLGLRSRLSADALGGLKARMRDLLRDGDAAPFLRAAAQTVPLFRRRRARACRPRRQAGARAAGQAVRPRRHGPRPARAAQPGRRRAPGGAHAAQR